MASDHEVYFDVGIGHKFEESYLVNGRTGKTYKNHSPTAHAALGYRHVKYDLSLDIYHTSNWLSGKPFDEEIEYYRTEIRLMKRFNLWKSRKATKTCRSSTRERALAIRVEQLQYQVSKLKADPLYVDHATSDQLALAVEHIKKLKIENNKLRGAK